MVKYVPSEVGYLFPSKTFLCLCRLKIIFTVSIGLAQTRLVLLLLVLLKQWRSSQI